MKNLLRRLPLALGLLLACLAARTAWALAGGGGDYGGGGGGGGGGGDGGGGGGGDIGDVLLLVIWWIQICVEYPYIGLPVTGVAIFVVYLGARTSHNEYTGYVIRKGTDALDATRQIAVTEAIQQNDPDFDPDAFGERVKGAFIRIQDAWCGQSLGAARPFISDSIYERFNLQLEEQRELGVRDRMEDILVQDVFLAQAVSDGVCDAVTVYIAGTARDYKVDAQTGQRLRGTADSKKFAEYWTLLRRRGSATRPGAAGLFEGHCPNCGAAIEMNQNANCASCKALLRSGEYDWVLAEITQPCDWRFAGDGAVPGLTELQPRDPDFNRTQFEDRASVMFWRWIMARRAGNAGPLKKVATPELLASVAAEWKPASPESGKDAERTYYGECAVGSVETKGLLLGKEVDRALVAVNWDGVVYRIGADGKAARTERSLIQHTLLVLRRKAGVTSAGPNGVGSAHCPSCGAPETGVEASDCEHCGAVLNDGTRTWVLTAVLPWASPEAEALRSELPQPAPAAAAPASQTGEARPVAHPAGLLAWAVKMASEDGTISPEEQKLLSQVAQRQGIEEERLERMLAAARSGALETPAPASRREAFEWLVAMAEMALADGRVTDEEWRLLYTAAERQGLTKSDARLVVNKTRARLYQEARAAIKDARKLPA